MRLSGCDVYFMKCLKNRENKLLSEERRCFMAMLSWFLTVLPERYSSPAISSTVLP